MRLGDVEPAARTRSPDAISTHDVRSDRLSRALYATDASVYQIVPLMVAFPATAADVVAAVQVCAQFGVPITARGGGTSQAGQSIGPGVILDCSKHLDRVLEINPDERWVRVEPGCVLDELNQALKPHGLLFAPDISTSNRATIGGMIANNSSGARSVLYGKTIDHVLELKTVLSDGSLVHLKPLDRAGARGQVRPGGPGRCLLPRSTRRLAAEHAEEIDRRFPKILRRVGGYNLDEFVPDRGRCSGRDPLQPRPALRRLGGNARRDGRGQAEAGRAAARPGHAGRPVRRPARSPGGDPD